MPIYSGIWDLMLAHRESLWRGMVVFFSLKLNSSTYSNHLFFEESIMTAVGNMWRWLRDSLLLFSRYILSDSLWPHGLQHARLPCPSISQSLLNLMSTESVMPSNHLILCHPFLLLPSIFPSIRVFSNESVLCILWPKYWSVSFSISPSNEYSGLISFRIDRFDLLAVQGTL